MPARPADWHLLDYDSDPAPGDPSAIDEVVRYYAEISEAISTQAALMRKIGSGDTTLLKGLAADAMRKRAEESAGTLEKAAARYHQMRQALETYRPELETARSETWTAVTEASDSSAGLSAARGMPDPVAETRPQDAPPLTTDQRQQSSSRSRAISASESGMASAKQRSQRAIAALDAAAQRASAEIRRDWSVDGLHTSGWDAFVYRLNKFLKKLVEVLTWIGTALAVLGLIISGVGIIALIGAAIAVVALVANIVLAAQGEASWVAVILGVIAVLTLGAGALVTKMTTAAIAVSKVAGATRLQTLAPRLNQQMANALRPPKAVVNFSRPLPKPIPNFSRPLAPKSAPNLNQPKHPPIVKQINQLADSLRPVAAIPIKPNFWQVRHPLYLQTNASKFKDVASKWQWQKMVGLDDVTDLKTINASVLSNFPRASVGKVKPWMYFGGPAFAWGWTTGVFGNVSSASTFPGDPRSQWPWADLNYSKFTSERTL